MLAEVLATIASIGNWFIHDLLRLRYLAWFLTSYFGTTLYINTELNSHVGTRGHRVLKQIALDIKVADRNSWKH